MTADIEMLVLLCSIVGHLSNLGRCAVQVFGCIGHVVFSLLTGASCVGTAALKVLLLLRHLVGHPSGWGRSTGQSVGCIAMFVFRLLP
mmetsp:Transcript_71293/g.183784  ORF Transcript_71293/g.183784 Transcript_71293/m.183784 type:complete len:88 (+) Transcript_71293:170-433(+)